MACSATALRLPSGLLTQRMPLLSARTLRQSIPYRCPCGRSISNAAAASIIFIDRYPGRNDQPFSDRNHFHQCVVRNGGLGTRHEILFPSRFRSARMYTGCNDYIDRCSFNHDHADLYVHILGRPFTATVSRAGNRPKITSIYTSH